MNRSAVRRHAILPARAVEGVCAAPRGADTFASRPPEPRGAQVVRRADTVRTPLPDAARRDHRALLVRLAAVLLALLPGRSGGGRGEAAGPAGQRGTRGRAVRLRRRARRARLARLPVLHRPRPRLPRVRPRGRVQRLRVPARAGAGRPGDDRAGVPRRPGPDEEHRRLPDPRPLRRAGCDQRRPRPLRRAEVPRAVPVHDADAQRPERGHVELLRLPGRGRQARDAGLQHRRRPPGPRRATAEPVAARRVRRRGARRAPPRDRELLELLRAVRHIPARGRGVGARLARARPVAGPEGIPRRPARADREPGRRTRPRRSPRRPSPRSAAARFPVPA